MLIWKLKKGKQVCKLQKKICQTLYFHCSLSIKVISSIVLSYFILTSSLSLILPLLLPTLNNLSHFSHIHFYFIPNTPLLFSALIEVDNIQSHFLSLFHYSFPLSISLSLLFPSPDRGSQGARSDHENY